MARTFPTKDELISFLASCPRPPKKRQIAQNFCIKGKGPRVRLKELLKTLKTEGHYCLPANKKIRTFQGVFVVIQQPTHDPMALLVRHDAKNQSPTQKLYPLIDVEKLRLNPGDHFYGTLKGKKINAIRRLEKQVEPFIGRAYRKEGAWYIASIDKKNVRTYRLDTGDHKFSEGIFVQAIAPEKIGGIAKFTRIIAEAHHISQLVINAHRLQDTFSDQALRIAKIYDVPKLEKREDLRQLTFVTIDGEDSRDLDDAVWAEKTETGWHLIVAIADVAHYVRPDTDLDAEALSKSTSVYFPDKVIPMLPEYLSNGLCALNPGSDRGALVAHIWIDNAGTIASFHFKRALIRSKKRLTYTQVEDYILGQKNQLTSDIMQAIDNLLGAHTSLKKARLTRNVLEIHTPELHVKFDTQNRIQNIGMHPERVSCNLIEEFMVVANVAAAQTLEKQGFPCLYRIHAQPDPEKIIDLRQTMKNLGIHFEGMLQTTEDFNKLLQLVADQPTHAIINEMVLRCQARATYASQNIGHFGLHLTHYTHFTSPIRRYADLLVHRALLGIIDPGDDSLPSQAYKHFADWGAHISKKEQHAVSAERDANDRFVTAFLSEHIGERYTGYVSGISRVGLFISLRQLPISGLLPIKALVDDEYRVHKRRLCLKGPRTGKIYKLGDPVCVVLTHANQAIGRLSFSLDKGDGQQNTQNTSPILRKTFSAAAT